MKMKKKMKNKSRRYDINRPRSRSGQRYSKHKVSQHCISISKYRQHLVAYKY